MSGQLPDNKRLRCERGALEADPELLRDYMIAGGKAFDELVARSLAKQLGKLGMSFRRSAFSVQ